MQEKANILMVDDQPAKLLSYEAILNELGENLIKANSGREALEHLLKTDIAVVLMDVSMATSALPGDGDYFHLRCAPDGPRPPQGIPARSS